MSLRSMTSEPQQVRAIIRRPALHRLSAVRAPMPALAISASMTMPPRKRSYCRHASRRFQPMMAAIAC